MGEYPSIAIIGASMEGSPKLQNYSTGMAVPPVDMCPKVYIPYPRETCTSVLTAALFTQLEQVAGRQHLLRGGAYSAVLESEAMKSQGPAGFWFDSNRSSSFVEKCHCFYLRQGSQKYKIHFRK